jgi:hypothetical protein
MNRNLAYENIPDEIITPEIIIEGEESKIEEQPQRVTHNLVDPAIAHVLKDEAITFIDASQIESSLLATSQNYTIPMNLSMPSDPAIVSYTTAHQYKNQK